MTAGTYPDVRSGLQKLLKDGLLLFNYTGHGGTTALSDEKVLTQTDINQFTYTHLPVWVTATCDFTRFDDLNTSAGEDVFLNKSSGALRCLRLSVSLILDLISRSTTMLSVICLKEIMGVVVRWEK